MSHDAPDDLLMGAGLLANICPPSSSFAAFHAAAATQKDLIIAPGHGHDGVENWLQHRNSFLTEALR